MKLAFDEAELREIKKRLLRFAPAGEPSQPFVPVLAFDPGKASMGWAVIDATGSLHSGQGPPAEIVSTIDDVFSLVGSPVLIAMEAPFSMSAARMAQGGANVQAIYALARASGFVEGALRCHLLDTAYWEPKPSTWRSVLGLNRRAGGEQTARDATADAVVAWVRATTKASMETARGKTKTDEAMAIALAFAMHHVALSVIRTLQAPRADLLGPVPQRRAPKRQSKSSGERDSYAALLRAKR